MDSNLRIGSRAIMFAISVALLGILLIVLLPSRAHATYWSWTASPPTIFESNPISDMVGLTGCRDSYVLKTIANDLVQRQVCASGNDKVIFGSYYINQARHTVVGVGRDQTMYALSSTVCDRFDSCMYVPESDIFVTKQYLINNLVGSLVIYKNFSKRLKFLPNDSNNILVYQFDSSHPDYTFKNSTTGYQWPVGGFGASDNGKWLAVEFRQRGVGLLNLETMEMRRISTMSLSYGAGSDSHSDFAVSNDGRHVALMGHNSWLYVYDVEPWCGDEVTDSRMDSVLAIATKCKTANIDINAIIYKFTAGLHPRFDEEGAELRFYVESFDGKQKEVILRAAGFTTPRLDYLAMGDSFSSGEGETTDAYYLNGTNDQYEKCHNSIRSYPYLIAEHLNIDPKYMRSVACSGATTRDVLGKDEGYWGQGERLGSGALNLNRIAKVLSQTTAREEFIPGRTHQIEFVKRYHPKVVTVGIGGNDVGFMEKLRACVGTGSCVSASTDAGREMTALEVARLFEKLVNAYNEIHSVSPGTKIYAVGYPNVMDIDGQCNAIDGALLDSSERKFMQQGIVYINQIIKAAAQKVGIKYLDIETSLGHHVLCGSERPIVMNTIRTGDDNSISDNISWVKIIGQEGFHPRPEAHKMIYSSIIQQVPDILSYSNCANGSVTCPSNVVAPKPSSYWIKDNVTHGYADAQISRFTNDEVDPTMAKGLPVDVSETSFAPGTTINATIHSKEAQLGNFVSNEKGGASFSVVLPTDIPDGYHTIHLNGLSYSGRPVDYYQIVRVLRPDAVVNQSAVPAADDHAAVEDGDLLTTQDFEATFADSYSTSTTLPEVFGSSVVSDVSPRPQFGYVHPTDTPRHQDAIIPESAWLFLGLSFTAYARLRRFR